MAQTKVKLISDGVIDVNHLASGHGITTDNIGEGSNLYYTDARVSTYLSTNNYATEGYVTTAVANLVDSAPTTLDTLNELAAALGDDPNFATTVTNSIATKLPLAGGTLTGGLHINTTSLPQLLIQNVDGGTNAERIAIELTSGDIFKIRSLNDNNTTRVDNIITANILTGNVGISASASFRFNGTGDETHAVGYDSVIDGSFLRGQNGIRFLTATGGGSEKMRITSAGVLQLGSDVTPALSSNFFISRGDQYGFHIHTQTGFTRLAASDDYLYLGTGTDTSTVTINGGKVGIGATSPSEKLQVNGNISISGVGNRLSFDTTGALRSNYIRTINDYETVIANERGAAGFAVIGNSNIRLGFGTAHTAGQSVLLINGSNNNVGIGETAPDTALHITKSTPTITIEDTSFTSPHGIDFIPTGYTSRGSIMMDYSTGEFRYSAGIANNSYYKTFYLNGSLVMSIGSTGRITFPGLDGKTQIHPDVSYRVSDGELFYQTSSERYKTDIVNLEDSLNKIISLRPVRFTDINTNEPSFGLIAEETFEIIPEVVFSKDDQIEGVSYSNLTPFLIKAIQEQQEIINNLKAEVEALKQQLNG